MVQLRMDSLATVAAALALAERCAAPPEGDGGIDGGADSDDVAAVEADVVRRACCGLLVATALIAGPAAPAVAAIGLGAPPAPSGVGRDAPLSRAEVESVIGPVRSALRIAATSQPARVARPRAAYPRAAPCPPVPHPTLIQPSSNPHPTLSSRPSRGASTVHRACAAAVPPPCRLAAPA